LIAQLRRLRLGRNQAREELFGVAVVVRHRVRILDVEVVPALLHILGADFPGQGSFLTALALRAAPPADAALQVLKANRLGHRISFLSIARAASKAAIAVARYQVKPDGTVVVVTGNPEPAAPGNAWPLDEFRTKETKQ